MIDIAPSIKSEPSVNLNVRYVYMSVWKKQLRKLTWAGQGFNYLKILHTLINTV